MNESSTSYIGRFAPSPTGPLHAGSLVAALASWLDAKAHGGKWLVRIEDVDTPRCIPGADRVILQQLADLGLTPDEPPVYQSQRGHFYQQALDQLIARHLAYPCNCSRKEIAEALALTGAQANDRERHSELIYPGTCRAGLRLKTGSSNQPAWRFLTTKPPKTPFGVPNSTLAGVFSSSSAIKSIANTELEPAHLQSDHLIIDWQDQRLGLPPTLQTQDVTAQVGDFVLKRADGLWAYQLAVVVDDALQGITHVVRGADLADNTPRQIALQHALGLPTPHYLHTPLVLAADGEKLSKQNGALALDTMEPLKALNSAAKVLGLPIQTGSVVAALSTWTLAWEQMRKPSQVYLQYPL